MMTQRTDVHYPAAHTLELHLRPVDVASPDPHRSDYGFRVYFGILPPGGASVEADQFQARIDESSDYRRRTPAFPFTRRKRDFFSSDFSDDKSSAENPGGFSSGASCHRKIPPFFARKIQL
ncbi:MAG: hypothetical protein LBO00_07090 [Zoogloeaceae bacterium]|jgi:hypothetical protein|nr:hypothetical protein [Zoogloeaceae bacterium]